MYRILFLRKIIIICLVAIMLVLTVLGILRISFPLKYVDYVIIEAREKGIDPYLLMAILKVESNFDPDAVSPKGARGLMQLMPATAQWVAKKADVKYHPDKLFDPAYNIKLGTWYLSDLLHDFNGNIWLAIAAYNGGRGNVKEWIATGRWLGDVEAIHKIPFAETRRFVQKVKIAWEIYSRLYPLILARSTS